MFTFSPQDIDITLRLFAATLLGGILGFERELHGKEAGLRTHTLVCLGAALIMIISVQIFDVYKAVATVDPSRIAAQAVTGIGFLGAGAIIRSPQRIKGLTTAAGIWTAAGIGLACGLGLYKPAVVTTVLTLFVLIVFTRLNKIIAKDEE